MPSTDEEWEKAARLERERLLAAAVRRLVRRDNIPAAIALADGEIIELGEQVNNEVIVKITTGDDSFDALSDPDLHERPEEREGNYHYTSPSVLEQVFTDVLPPGQRCGRVEIKVRQELVPETWREDFKASLGRGAVNQGNIPGVPAAPYESDDGLRYRSKSEMKLADELKRRAILYMPLPVAVISAKARREPDFVLFHKGRVGIIEVHGAPWHPASRSAEDHARALPFRMQNIEVLDVDAAEAFNHPDLVVDRFLELLLRPR